MEKGGKNAEDSYVKQLNRSPISEQQALPIERKCKSEMEKSFMAIFHIPTSNDIVFNININ